MEPLTLSLLRSIYRSQPTTRRALSEQTGLTVSRISALVTHLTARCLIREEAGQPGTPGRPANSLFVNPDAGRVVGLDIGSSHARAVLSDLTGHCLASVIRPIQPVPDRAAILGNVVGLVEAVCREGGMSPDRLAALGIGVGGIIDARTSVVLDWPSAPAWAAGWAGLDVPTELGRRLGDRLIVADDRVRLMGIAAHRHGPAQNSANFLYVFVGSGIGSAAFFNGQPYRGGIGLAGEVGHVTVDEGGPWCSCGNRGCLEVLASVPAILQRVRERVAGSPLMSPLRGSCERGELTLDALIEAARAGDKLAFQVLDEAGTQVGKVLAIALNLLGSELVVLGGPLAQDGGIILEAVQRQVRLRALQYISSQTRIVCDDGGELAGARGAALLALDALFASPEYLMALVDGQMAKAQLSPVNG